MSYLYLAGICVAMLVATLTINNRKDSAQLISFVSITVALWLCILFSVTYHA